MDEAGEFQDWEMLQNTDPSFVPSSDSVDNSRDFGGIEGDSEGVIRSDYFTLDSGKRYARTVAESDLGEETSVDSDNPSWVDPCLEPRFGDDASQGIKRKISGEFWSDSSSDRSVSQKNDSGYGDDTKNVVGFEEFGAKDKDSDEFWSDSGGVGSHTVKFRNFEGEVDSDSGDYDCRRDDPEFLAEAEGQNGSRPDGLVEVGLGTGGLVEAGGGETSEGTGTISLEKVKSGEEEKKRMVWWKLPLELLKFCVFRVSPVWSFSIAAAMIGIVILRRRLYKMRQKNQGIQLKVTIDDKKVSQFMVRAARLNEAFSVVRRVPIIRSSLPAVGVTPWPVMSLR